MDWQWLLSVYQKEAEGQAPICCFFPQYLETPMESFDLFDFLQCSFTKHLNLSNDSYFHVFENMVSFTVGQKKILDVSVA